MMVEKERAMTPEELAAIKVRAEAATPGAMVPYEHGSTLGWSFDTEDGTLPCGIRGMFERREDAVFYAHARDDVPALVAEVERLRQALDDYGGHSEGCSGQYGPSYRCRCGWRDEARALGIGVHEEGAS
jgi:hypothetical protein